MRRGEEVVAKLIEGHTQGCFAIEGTDDPNHPWQTPWWMPPGAQEYWRGSDGTKRGRHHLFYQLQCLDPSCGGVAIISEGSIAIAAQAALEGKS